MRVRALRRILAWTGHYALLLAFVAFALFPLFWLLKVSVTPDDLLYGEGVRLWPSRMTLAHYGAVIAGSQFPLFFRNSVIVASSTAVLSTVVASGAGYGFSRFVFRGRFLIVGVMLVTQMFPLVMIVAPIFRLLSPLGLTNSPHGARRGLHGVQRTLRHLPDAVLLRRNSEGARGGCDDSMGRAASRHCGSWCCLTLPGIAATLGFVFTAAWSELLFALMLNSSTDASTFPVGLLAFVSKFSVDFGQMMAAGVLALLPVVSLLPDDPALSRAGADGRRGEGVISLTLRVPPPPRGRSRCRRRRSTTRPTAAGARDGR